MSRRPALSVRDGVFFMDMHGVVTELRPIRIPTLVEARLLVPALKLPRRLPPNAVFAFADWFLGAPSTWESIALRYCTGAGWLRLHQIEPTLVAPLRAHTPMTRVEVRGRSLFTATLHEGLNLVEWQDTDGRRYHLTSAALSLDDLTAIAGSTP